MKASFETSLASIAAAALLPLLLVSPLHAQVFNPIPTYTLAVARDGTGGGTVTGIGIQCGMDCVENFLPGSLVTLTAAPLAGSVHSAWRNCDAPPGAPCTVTMDAMKTVTAVFSLLNPPPPPPQARHDFNGDARSELLWHHLASGTLYVYGFELNGTPLQGVVDSRDPSFKVAGVGDLNGDGRADVVWRNLATGEVIGVLLDGTAKLGEATLYVEPDLAWRIEQVADVDGDKKADLVWRNANTGEVFVAKMDGLEVNSGQVVYVEPDATWKIEAAADANADGKADLLWRNTVTGAVFVMLMDGLSAPSGSVVYTEPESKWRIAGFADLTGDGRADVIWRHAVTGDVYRMDLDGASVVGGQMIYSEPDPNWQIVMLGRYLDPSLKSSADILWRNAATGEVATLAFNDSGVFLGGGVFYMEPDPQWTIVAR